MIAVRVIVAMLVTVDLPVIVVMPVIVAMPVLVSAPAVIMRLVVMLVIMGSRILVPLSWRVFVLVAVLELTVAVGMAVHRGHEARLPPAGRSLARFGDD
jgi:hypothetical protein